MDQKSTNEKSFTSERRDDDFFASKYERKIVGKAVDYVPKPIETYHLTLSSILWCGLVILFGYLSTQNIQWLWGTSIIIVLYYITDLLDGAVGRKRNTGLVKWGYYMDHFFDYLFLCSLIIGYTFLLKPEIYMVIILAIFAGFMISVFLNFAVTEKFRISFLKIGPTEIRVLFVTINTLLIFFYNKIRFDVVLPISAAISLFCLILLVYETQKDIWKEDMKKKESLKNGG